MNTDYDDRFFTDQRVYSILGSGESLMWSATPDKKRLFLVLLPLLAFASFWTYSAVKSLDRFIGGAIPDISDPQFISFSIQILFLTAGVVMFVFFFWFYNRTRKIRYALTDRRFIVLDGEEVHNFTTGQLSGMSSEGKRGARIKFRSLGDVGLSGDLTGKPKVTAMTVAALLLGFFTLPGFRRVVGMMKDMKSRARPDTAQPEDNELS